MVLVQGAEPKAYSVSSYVLALTLALISLYLETEPSLEVVLKTTQLWLLGLGKTLVKLGGQTERKPGCT